MFRSADKWVALMAFYKLVYMLEEKSVVLWVDWTDKRVRKMVVDWDFLLVD